MAPSTQISNQISESKARRSHLSSSWVVNGLEHLLFLWGERSPSPHRREQDDFFIIRAVTHLEVFVRLSISELVDNGAPYLENGLSLARNLKFDLEMAKEMEGKKLTIGDLISYTISVNNATQLVTNLGVCLGKNLTEYLATPLVRAESPYRAPASTDLSDSASVLANLDKLFRVRHILVHELLNTNAYEVSDVQEWLQAALDFVKAASSRVSYLLHGTFPVSTSDMVHAANQETLTLKGELREIITAIQGDTESLQLLEKSQTTWEAFVNAQATYRADNARGGTISGVLFALEERDQYKLRVAALRWYLERAEGDM